MLKKGAKTQEYFVYFKFEQRSSGTKDPQRAEGVFIQCFLKEAVLWTLSTGRSW